MFIPKGYYTSQGYTGFLPDGSRMAFPRRSTSTTLKSCAARREPEQPPAESSPLRLVSGSFTARSRRFMSRFK